MATTLPITALERLEQALERSWSAATSTDSEHWTPENPAWGQCAVTALIVQDHFGGELLRCSCQTGSHYLNRVDGGRLIDLTAVQFGPEFVASGAEPRTRDYVLSFPQTRRRYEELRARVDDVLGA